MEKIIRSSVNNNCTGKLNIGIQNSNLFTITGRTMCANLLSNDLTKWISKQVSTADLVDKYFHLENGIFKYSNPKK